MTGSSALFLSAAAFMKPFDHLRQAEMKRMVQTYLAYLSDSTNLISNPGILVSILGCLASVTLYMVVQSVERWTCEL